MMTVLTNNSVINIKEEPLVFPEIVHDDHPITFDHMEWIQTHPELLKESKGTFVVKLLTLPEGMERVQSALYGPSAGDPVITEDEVVYQKRIICDECSNSRKGYSRMIDRPTRPANNIVVIGIIGVKAITIYGTQASSPSPKEDWDSACSDNVDSYRLSKEFWSMHALSMHEKS